MAAFPTSDFEAAVKSFQEELPNRDEFDFRGIETIDDVYREISIIQEEQGRKRELRYMKRIEPFLNCLEQYSQVLDTFVQVKPNVLALIWVCMTLRSINGSYILNHRRGQSNFFFKYDHGSIADERADQV